MAAFIRQKKTYCGRDYLDVALYPYTDEEKKAAREGKRSKREKVSSPKQVNLNEKNARRYFEQYVKTNFGEGDLHVTVTYANKFLPLSIEEAERQIRNFLKRVANHRKADYLSPLKYILVTVYGMSKDGERPVRIHHHIFMNGGLNRDAIEGLWRKRKRAGQKQGDKIGAVNADRLQLDEDGLAAICAYIAKQTGGKKRWSSSHNLDKPEKETDDPGDPPRTRQSRFSASANLERPWSRTNDHAWTKREVEKIAKSPPEAEYWERRYPGYTLVGGGYGFVAEYSEFRGWAAYVKLRRIKEKGGT